MVDANTSSGQRIVLARNPSGPLAASDFRIEAQPELAPDDGEFLIRNRFVSVDPMLRLLIDAAPLGGTVPPMPVGTTIPGAAVGEVVASRHPDFKIGDTVEGRFGWQNFAVSKGVGVNRVGSGLALEHALGVGGLPGFTAYVGLELAAEKASGTVLVSGAAGAVGSVVGPMVRARGGSAVGIASGADKCRYLVEEAGYAAAADRTAPDFEDQLRAALPKGADLYFDNVGGPMMTTVLPFLALGARILICGLMAQYEKTAEASGGKDNLPTLLHAIMGKGLRIEAFTQLGRDAMRPAFEAELSRLLADGAIRPKIKIEEGIERLPDALAGLFAHSVPGKVVVRVA